jgi:MerR family transcriptional regulator/heat shock protein HspR
MTKEFWTVREVVDLFQIEETFLADLEEEEILCPECPEDSLNKLFSSRELEKLHLAKILVEDMGINLAGVDVILRMRSRMIEMRKQFDAILEDLAQHVQEAFKKSPDPF